MAETTEIETTEIANAVARISAWWKSVRSPCERCEHCEIVGFWLFSPTCGARVSENLVRDHAMTSVLFGGKGFKCKNHLCVCDTENDYAEEQCWTCLQQACVKCGWGCTCGSTP